MAQRLAAGCFLSALVLTLVTGGAGAQSMLGGPPAVDVVRAARQEITQSTEYIGRIQAIGRVSLVAAGEQHRLDRTVPNERPLAAQLGKTPITFTNSPDRRPLSRTQNWKRCLPIQNTLPLSPTFVAS
jgi:hypothetical protein